MSKDKKLTKVIFYIIIGFSSVQSSAWERTSIGKCQQEARNCAENLNTCPCLEQCQRKALEEDMSSFVKSLTPYSRSIFWMYTPQQKAQAMDYADRTGLSPEDAVAKVAAETP